MYKKFKIEVGQVWFTQFANETYQISKIVGVCAYAINSRTRVEDAFIFVDDNLNGEIETDCWTLMSGSSSTKSRECPCGIVRIDCDYHK